MKPPLGEATINTRPYCTFWKPSNRRVRVSREYYLNPPTLSSVNQIIDKQARSNRMQTILNFLNEDKRTSLRFLNMLYNSYDAGFTRTKVKFRIPLLISFSKSEKLSILLTGTININRYVRRHITTKDTHDFLPSLI